MWEWIRKWSSEPQAKSMRKRYLKQRIGELTDEVNDNLDIAKELGKLEVKPEKETSKEVFVELYIKLANDGLDEKEKHRRELKFLSSNRKTKNIDQTHINQAKSTKITDLGLLEGVIQTSQGRYKAKCPFHDDHDPSLVIYEDTNSYYCFVCQEYGDSISLVQKQMNLSFIEAVKYLCKIT